MGKKECLILSLYKVILPTLSLLSLLLGINLNFKPSIHKAVERPVSFPNFKHVPHWKETSLLNFSQKFHNEYLKIISAYLFVLVALSNSP